jgi:hypothetical protein
MHNFSTGRKKKEEKIKEQDQSLRGRETFVTKMEVILKMNDDGMTITSGESELKTKTATGIGHFLMQKLIRVKKFEKLIQHPVHRASYMTLRNNVSSNAMLTDIYIDSQWSKEQTVYQHQPTYGDGSTTEEMKIARDSTTKGSRCWHTF